MPLQIYNLGNPPFWLTFLISFLFLTSWGYSQDIHIVSNTTQWVASDNYDGPWHTPVSQQGIQCHDPNYIEEQCGSWYANPNNQIDSCEMAEPIWGGTDPNNDCYWPQKTYYFRTTFNLPDTRLIEDVKGWIAVDNFFDIYVNDQKAGDEGVGGLRWSIDYDLTDSAHDHVNILPYLHSGENEIIVAARNVHGGSCFNFALFAFCMKIYISDLGGESGNGCTDLNQVNIYPNPTNDLAYIDFICQLDSVEMVRLYDYSGQEILIIEEDRDPYKINTEFLPSGIYIVRVSFTNGEEGSERLIVTH